MMRAIHLFPDVEAVEGLAAFRRRNDPLAGKIPPHITLVFPFESEIEDGALAAHVRQATDTKVSFSIVLGPAEHRAPDYLWLPVVRGERRIHHLHADLYTGPLASFRDSGRAYLPHLTIGRVDSGQEEALREARAIILPDEIPIDRVVIERIDAEGMSEPLGSFPLLQENRIRV